MKSSTKRRDCFVVVPPPSNDVLDAFIIYNYFPTRLHFFTRSSNSFGGDVFTHTVYFYGEAEGGELRGVGEDDERIYKTSNCNYILCHNIS